MTINGHAAEGDNIFVWRGSRPATEEASETRMPRVNGETKEDTMANDHYKASHVLQTAEISGGIMAHVTTDADGAPLAVVHASVHASQVSNVTHFHPAAGMPRGFVSIQLKAREARTATVYLELEEARLLRDALNVSLRGKPPGGGYTQSGASYVEARVDDHETPGERKAYRHRYGR